MISAEKQLTKPGVYLFHPPTKVHAQIDRELLIVFNLQGVRLSGVLLFDDKAPLRELEVLLSILYKKTVEKLGVDRKFLTVKVFGSSHNNRLALEAVYRWMQDRELTVAAADTGKNVARRILIDCDAERVGISYAESIDSTRPSADERELAPIFLSSKTSRSREGISPRKKKVLILAVSPVHRTLAKQSVEESESWKAFAPTHPAAYLLKPTPEVFSYRWIVVLQSLAANPGLKPWLQKMKANFPKVKICWVGKTPVKPLAIAATISELDPQRVDSFKASLQSILAPATKFKLGEVLPFKATKRKIG